MPFWFGIGYGFEGTRGVYMTAFVVSFPVKYERIRVMCEFFRDFKKSFCWPPRVMIA